MKKKGFFPQRVYPVLFMFLLTAVLIAAVAYVNIITRDRIERNEKLYLIQAVLHAAGLPADKDAQVSADLYAKRIVEVLDDKGTILSFRVKDDSGKDSGTVVFGNGPGLWGEITAVIGFSLDGKTITGVDFTKQNETPGLGARIVEDWFRDQFKGKSGPFVIVAPGEPKGDFGVDSITGASWSSRYAVDIINNAAASR